MRNVVSSISENKRNPKETGTEAERKATIVTENHQKKGTANVDPRAPPFFKTRKETKKNKTAGTPIHPNRRTHTERRNP